MDETVIDNLNIEIESDSTKAIKSIDALLTSLESLEKVLKKSDGVDKFAQSMSSFTDTIAKLDKIQGKISTLDKLSETLTKLNNIGSSRNLNNTLETLMKIPQALDALKWVTVDESFKAKMQGMADSLKPLVDISTTGFNSAIKTLSGLPEIIKQIGSMSDSDMQKFNDQIKKLTDYMGPLSAEMAKVSAGMSLMPANIQKVVNANAKLTSSFKSVNDIFANMMSTFRTMKRALNAIYDVFSELFTSSADYVETMNLFKVSMGGAADAALEYARTVQSMLGINISEWLQGQGALQQLLQGYGIANDTAALMSQNLTQLVYDLSSLWNSDVSTAFNKVESGMSGQIKGLKVWGLNLSVAQLRQTALAHGITLSTAKMTEAQRAILRYVYLMENTSNIQGDLARTILTPANSLRILNAQWEYCKIQMGNVVSVVATKIIPVFKAAVNVLTDFSVKLADTFGYELSTDSIDYSGLEYLEDEIDSTTEAAETLKKSLLGFDEINKLSNSTTVTIDNNGYDSTLGIDLTQYNYDFLSSYIEDTTELEEKLRSILEIVGLIGVALLAWKVTAEISKMFSGGSMVPVAVGLQLYLTFDSVKEMVLNGFSWTELLKIVASAVGTGLSVGILAGSATVGLIAAVGVGIVATIIGINAAQKEQAQTLYDGSGIKTILDGLKTKIEENASISADIKVTLNATQLSIDSTDAEYTGYIEMVEKLYALIDKEVLTKGDVTLIQGYVDVLNSLNIEDLSASFNDATGKIDMTREAMTKLIDEQLRLIQISAYSDALKTAYTSKVQATDAVSVAEANKAAADNALKQAKELYDSYQLIPESELKFPLLQSFGSTWSSLLNTEAGAAKLAYEEAVAVSEQANTAYTDASAALEAATSDITTWENELINLTATTDDTTESQTELQKVVAKFRDTVTIAESELPKVSDKFVVIDKSATDAGSAIDDLIDKLALISAGKAITFTVTGSVLNAYANGGTPSTGELFIARESGPELVGSMGGKTTVANNNDIENGIEEAAYRGFMRAAEKNGGGTWIIQITDEDGKVTGETIITAAERMNRRNGKTMITVGAK